MAFRHGEAPTCLLLSKPSHVIVGHLRGPKMLPRTSGAKKRVVLTRDSVPHAVTDPTYEAFHLPHDSSVAGQFLVVQIARQRRKGLRVSWPRTKAGNLHLLIPVGIRNNHAHRHRAIRFLIAADNHRIPQFLAPVSPNPLAHQHGQARRCIRRFGMARLATDYENSAIRVGLVHLRIALPRALLPRGCTCV